MTGTLAKYTGGQVLYYPAFQAHLHGEKFSYELARDLSRETAWEAVMRIRCGKGTVLRESAYFHYYSSSSWLISNADHFLVQGYLMQLILYCLLSK